MPNYTNITRNLPLDITVGSKNGEAIVETLQPGETKNIDLDKEHPQIKALLTVQQLAVGKEAGGAPNNPASKEKASS